MGLLSPHQKLFLKKLCPKDQYRILWATVAQLHRCSDSSSYIGQEKGILALTQDHRLNKYYFKLLDQSNGALLWEYKLPDHFNYYKDRSYFHSFSYECSYFGFLFDDVNEATHFYKKVVNKEKYGKSTNTGDGNSKEKVPVNISSTESKPSSLKTHNLQIINDDDDNRSNLNEISKVVQENKKFDHSRDISFDASSEGDFELPLSPLNDELIFFIKRPIPPPHPSQASIISHHDISSDPPVLPPKDNNKELSRNQVTFLPYRPLSMATGSNPNSPPIPTFVTEGLKQIPLQPHPTKFPTVQQPKEPIALAAPYQISHRQASYEKYQQEKASSMLKMIPAPPVPPKFTIKNGPTLVTIPLPDEIKRNSIFDDYDSEDSDDSTDENKEVTKKNIKKNRRDLFIKINNDFDDTISYNYGSLSPTDHMVNNSAVCKENINNDDYILSKEKDGIRSKSSLPKILENEGNDMSTSIKFSGMFDQSRKVRIKSPQKLK